MAQDEFVFNGQFNISGKFVQFVGPLFKKKIELVGFIDNCVFFCTQSGLSEKCNGAFHGRRFICHRTVSKPLIHCSLGLQIPGLLQANALGTWRCQDQ